MLALDHQTALNGRYIMGGGIVGAGCGASGGSMK